ncbi:MAG TPA: bifunctional DNA primase/polymerase [Smithella sp.]|nr:bifunctional DNA primase/polymerase [Smithella sp.]
MNDIKNILTSAALNYAGENNFSIIPLQKNKKPYIQWAVYQHRKATAGEIKAWWSKWPHAMLGIVTGQISGLFVVDCDTQEGFDAVQELLPDSLNIPTARTPRGGWHFYFQYPADSKLSVQAGIMPGVDIRGEGGYIVAAPSMNGNGRGYEWLDGLSLAEVAPPPMPDALLSAFNNIINNSLYRRCGLEKPHETTKTTQDHIFEHGKRDDNLYHIASCLAKTGNTEDYIRQTLAAIIFSWGETHETWINAKIQSAFKRIETQERNLAAEIKEWIETTRGHFETTQAHRELHITTKREMKTCQMVLSRLCDGEKPLLEKYGDKRGVYRRVENDIEPVNFLTAPTDDFPLVLPLGIDKYCKLYPGNIVIVAGSKSAGKTAFLLNIVRENMKKHEIVYLNSEMGDTEFRKRLELFDDVKLTDWKFRPYHRAANFADLITPEKKIFIVDFLEITTDFWKVAQYIREIHNKLKEGVCIIALQKSEGKDNGRGGDFSKEKTRLYISLDYLKDKKVNQVKIVDAKAWRTEINPRGLYRNYKLVEGSKFIPDSEWEG